MKKIVGLILIAVAVCAIASLLFRSRRRGESEEHSGDVTESVADQDELLREEGVAAPAVSEPA